MDPVQKPCSNCRRRKVRCDKALPCSNCVRLKYQCNYDDQPESNQQLVLDQPATIELFARLSRLEGLINGLRASNTSAPGSASGSATGNFPNGNMASDRMDFTSSDVGSDRLQGPASTTIFGTSQGVETEKSASSRTHGLDNIFPLLPGAIPTPTETVSSTPTTQHFNPLLELFLDITEPFIRVVHPPKLIQDLANHQNGISSKEFEALLRCVHAVTVVTLPAGFVVDMFGKTRDVLAEGLQRAAEGALQRADFLTSTDLMVLQGLLLYITVLFERLEREKASAMIGVALRHALRLGLHRDPTHLSPQLSSIEAEIRRRIWCYLQHLDIKAQEVLGVESCMSGPAHWDTTLPWNVDDEVLTDFVYGDTQSQIVRGCTIMTFVLARHRLERLHKQFMDSQNGSAPPISPHNTKTMIETCGREIEHLYLSDIDQSNPMQRLVAALLRARLLKIELIARRTETPGPLEAGEAFQQFLSDFDADPDLARWSWLVPPRSA